MTISRLTVDKLGVRLYDRVSAVVAELVANSYDADATEVTIRAPMGEFLAVKRDGRLEDRGFELSIADNGIGMTPTEVQEFYLKVGGERRNDERRGDESRKFKRKVMGRKGVGKLAPFGICQEIEVLTSGGDLVTGVNEVGEISTGYQTAHLVLNRDEIVRDVDYNYEPEVGPMDGKVLPKSGTKVTLRVFSRRQVPAMTDFQRQLAQRFGVKRMDWEVELVDSNKEPHEEGYSTSVGQFDIDLMDNTKIEFKKRLRQGAEEFVAIAPDGNILADVDAGFEYEGAFYPVEGWVGYAKDNYKDDVMAGVRIYCRGKIAAQTAIFNRGSGFYGEHSIRSYLVGEIHADWLDEKEDLIQTDRRDILWSDELGRAFEKWGQDVVERVGRLSRDPMKKKTFEKFEQVADIKQRAKEAFPADDQRNIRDNAMDFAKMIGQRMRPDEVDDVQYVTDMVDLSLMLAPHISLTRQLREAAENHDTPLAALSGILRTAQIAELSSYGRIAHDRVKVIENVEQLKDDDKTREDALQKLIQSAPWLINPQWSPITSNQSFATLQKEFQKFYNERTGENIDLTDFTDPSKRADFVLSSQDGIIQIIEIKRPKHKLKNDELDRIVKYEELMTEFLTRPAHAEFVRGMSRFHITLVCDELALTGAQKSAFDGYCSRGMLTHIDWSTFLMRTIKAHQDFIAVAEKQRTYAARSN